jgi:hypothetical protein
MPTKFIVRKGDCLQTIAYTHGFFWETVWNDSLNDKLRQKCKTPNILAPGDEIFIPDKRPKQYEGATEQRHCFKLKGVPFKLQIRLVDGSGKLRTGIPYVLLFPTGETFRDNIPSDGWIKHHIPPTATTAILQLTDHDQGITEQYALDLGGLDPIYEVTGIQQRLRNLGYEPSDAPGSMGPGTAAALRSFQEIHGLTPSGEADKRTLDTLLEVHGC